MSTEPGPDLEGEGDDPYAPPRSVLAEDRMFPRAGVVPFELGAMVDAAWAIFKARLGSCLAVTWTVLVLVMIAQYVQRLVAEDFAPDPANRPAYFLAQFGAFFAGWAFNSWLTIGQNLALLAVARDLRPAYPRVFRGFPFLLTTLLAGLVFMAAVGLAALCFLIWVPVRGGMIGPGGGAGVAAAVCFACALLAAGYVGLRLSQYHLMIVDQGAGVLEALLWSWEVTRRHEGTLLLVWLTVLLVNLAGLLPCFLGLPFTIPFTNVVLTVTFLALTGQPVGTDRKPPASEIEFLE
jgi:hypothetical protein